MEDVSCILRLHLLFYNVLLVSNRWMCGGIVESTISGALLSDRGTGHWAYKSYDVTTPLTTQTVSPRGSRSPCPDQKGIRGFWGNIISVLSVALSLRLGFAVVRVDARGVPESELASRQEGDFGERLSLCCRSPCPRGWSRRSLLLTRGV